MTVCVELCVLLASQCHALWCVPAYFTVPSSRAWCCCRHSQVDFLPGPLNHTDGIWPPTSRWRRRSKGSVFESQAPFRQRQC